MAKIQTFLCIGGPLDGHSVTEQYAGYDYHRFISSDGELYPEIILGKCHISGKSPRARKAGIKPFLPKNILLYCPRPKPIDLWSVEFYNAYRQQEGPST